MKEQINIAISQNVQYQFRFDVPRRDEYAYWEAKGKLEVFEVKEATPVGDDLLPIIVRTKLKTQDLVDAAFDAVEQFRLFHDAKLTVVLAASRAFEAKKLTDKRSITEPEQALDNKRAALVRDYGGTFDDHRKIHHIYELYGKGVLTLDFQ